MDPKSFLQELQRIQCDLDSGVETLGQIERMLTEEPLPNHYCNMLYVLSAYMQGVYRSLAQCVHSYEREQAQ